MSKLPVYRFGVLISPTKHLYGESTSDFRPFVSMDGEKLVADL